MRSAAVPLAAAALLLLSPAAALASDAQPAPPPAVEDPCAPVDGQVPLLCQSGPAAQPGELPRTGPAPYAGGAVLLLLAGGGVLLLQRRWLPQPATG